MQRFSGAAVVGNRDPVPQNKRCDSPPPDDEIVLLGFAQGGFALGECARDGVALLVESHYEPSVFSHSDREEWLVVRRGEH